MNVWVKLGAPKNKLVVGFPFYGRSFKLVNANDNGIYAPASGDPDAGEFTKESGTLAYFEVSVVTEPLDGGSNCELPALETINQGRNGT